MMTDTVDVPRPLTDDRIKQMLSEAISAQYSADAYRLFRGLIESRNAPHRIYVITIPDKETVTINGIESRGYNVYYVSPDDLWHYCSAERLVTLHHLELYYERVDGEEEGYRDYAEAAANYAEEVMSALAGDDNDLHFKASTAFSYSTTDPFDVVCRLDNAVFAGWVWHEDPTSYDHITDPADALQHARREIYESIEEEYRCNSRIPGYLPELSHD